MKEIGEYSKRNLVLAVTSILIAGVITVGYTGIYDSAEEENDPRANMTESEICSRIDARVEVVDNIVYVHNEGSLKIREIQMVWNGAESGTQSIKNIETGDRKEVKTLNMADISEIKLVSHSCGNKMLDTYRSR